MTANAVTVHDPQQGAVSAPSMNAPARGGIVRLAAPMKEIIAAHKELDELIEQALEEGPNKDYGPAPGADEKSTKRILYKSGAEKVAKWHNCFPHYDVVEREVSHDVIIPWRKRFKARYGKNRGEWQETTGESLGLYRYVVRCSLIYRPTGEVVGDGIGICSTLESKYIDRPRDLENTVVKMAQKRAMLAAVLNAFALSDRFTQDLEDMARDDDDERVETQQTRPAQEGQQQQQQQQRAEDVDERGVGVVVFGAEGVRGRPIDDPDLSIEFLVSYYQWFASKPETAKRFPNACVQLRPVIEQRIKAGAFENDDAGKVIAWVVKKDERRALFQWVLDAFAERQAEMEAEALKRQQAEAEAELAGAGGEAAQP